MRSYPNWWDIYPLHGGGEKSVTSIPWRSSGSLKGWLGGGWTKIFHTPPNIQHTVDGSEIRQAPVWIIQLKVVRFEGFWVSILTFLYEIGKSLCTALAVWKDACSPIFSFWMLIRQTRGRPYIPAYADLSAYHAYIFLKHSNVQDVSVACSTFWNQINWVIPLPSTSGKCR